MSLNSASDGHGGASVGAMPSLTSGAAYATWAPLFLNYCASMGLGDVLRKDVPDWRGKCAMAQAWADEADDEMYAAAASGGSASSVKMENAKTAAATAEMRAARAGVLKKINDSRRVYGALYRTLPEGLRVQIPTDEGHAFALWRWLENKFQSKEADSVGALWSEWVTMSMRVDEDFDAYRARVNKLHTLLTSAKEVITPALYALTLLDRLQPRYLPAVLALRTSKEENGLKDLSKTDWDAVTKVINAHERHEQRLNGSAGEDGLERTMAAFSRQQRGKQTFPPSNEWSAPDWMKGVRCFACKELGHTVKFCKDTQKLEKWLAEKRGRDTAASAVQHKSRRGSEEWEERAYAFSATVSTATQPKTYAEAAAPMKKQVAAAAAAPLSPQTQPAGARPGVPVAPKKMERQEEVQKKQKAMERATSSSSPRRTQGLAAEKVAPSLPPSPPLKKQTTKAALASTDWGVDSMASYHLSGNKTLFTELKTAAGVDILTADGGRLHCTQQGSIRLRLMTAKGEATSITIEDVCYHESAAANLLSVGVLTNLGWEFHLAKDDSQLITPEKSQVRLSRRDRVMVLEQAEEKKNEETARQQCATCAGCVCMRAKGETPLSDSRTKEIKNGGDQRALQQLKLGVSGAGAQAMTMMTMMTPTTMKKKGEEGRGSLGDDTLRHVKATSVKSISGVEETAKGFQPEARRTEGLEPRDECPTQTTTEVCAGALLLPIQPNQADSCSVELTEGWCRAAF